jgi:chloramphenicol-sensitive protein RarD
MPGPPAPGESRLALTAGAGCFLIWGFVPLYFQATAAAGATSWEILAHRIIWSVPTAALFVGLASQWPQVRGVFRDRRTLGWLFVSAMLISVNWVVFIWSVNSGRVLEMALGYYINPLVNVAAGALIFRERIRRAGQVAIALAVAGVALQAAAIGSLPLVSLALAFSFGGYGIVRKRVSADAQTGLFLECLLISLPCLAYIAWLQATGAGHATQPVTLAWLLVSGPVTAVPLVLFAWAARRMPLSAMGFLQFTGPTIGFFIGVAQGEPFTPLRMASFAFIWGAAAVFLWGAWKATRPIAQAAAAE